MAERPIVTELRAVDAALAPLSPSRELDERLDALLAGRAPRAARPRLVLVGLGACAAAAAIALMMARGEPTAVVVAPAALPEVPASSPRAPAAPPPSEAPSEAPSIAAPRPDESPHEALALAAPTSAAPAPPAPALQARALAPVASPVEHRDPGANVPRGGVFPLPDARGALTANAVVSDPAADAALEAALGAVRADKARGDVRGALARVDALLASSLSPRAHAALRLERARLLERLGERAAACASLADLAGDDVQAARARMACP